MNTRRQFLITAPLAAAAAAGACRAAEQSSTSTAPPATPGAPPTFGTGPITGPPVSSATFAEAGKLAQVTMSEGERELAAASWQRTMAPLVERRIGPRKVALDPNVAPATRWNPVLGGVAGPSRDVFARSAPTAVPLPSSDADIAYAPVTQLSRSNVFAIASGKRRIVDDEDHRNRGFINGDRRQFDRFVGRRNCFTDVDAFDTG